MAESSPARPRSYQWASPARSVLSDILYDELERNTEARHNAEIEQVQKARNKVREDAERILRLFEQNEKHRLILEEKRKEEERIRQEQILATERMKLLELKAKKVEIPPLPPPSPEPPKAPVVVKSAPKATTSEVAPKIATPIPQTVQNGTPVPVQPSPGKPALSSQTNLASPFALKQTATSPLPKPQTPVAPGPGGSGLPTNQPQAQVNGAAPSQAQQTAPTDRHRVVHRNLKLLRAALNEQAKSNPALKARMGDMRREVRKNVGQLTGGAGANRKQQTAINSLLREALQNQVQSQMMDPGEFVLEPREPKEGAVHNGQMPSIFLYMVNALSKAAISQFINEAGARPETADPVGVVLASTFSEPDFQWRGVSLIDILMAKFAVVCPVVFGLNGKESTEQGRARLGWWKEGSSWIPEQQHMDRMTGLGAGFAAISLRNFRKSTKVNPYPPRNYWLAMARLVNTAPAEVSDTQCVVLKAMIQNYETKFLDAYGDAGVAALRLALVDLPRKSLKKSAAVSSLEVHAAVFRRETGLDLTA